MRTFWKSNVNISFLVKLKANKYYKELLYYLSFYFILLNIRLLRLAPGSWPIQPLI